jgi:pyrroline-5-carboxylate reductase
MGSALASAVCRGEGVSVLAYDVDAAKVEALVEAIGATAAMPDDICREADFVFLAVKPNMIATVLMPLADTLANNKNAVLVSMAAGVKLDTLRGLLKENTPVIRIMPNTSVAIGAGMTAYAATDNLTESREAQFLAVMEPTGTVDKIPERLIDAESAIAGSGPAFVYMFIDALADGGVLCGLPRDKALLYAAKTLEGAAKTLVATGKHPAALKDAVCSPGGSTIEGVLTLEAGGFRSTVSDAVIATCEKAKKLG